LKRALVLVALAACGDTTPTVTSSVHINRPTDMAFACYGQMRFNMGGSATVDQPIDLSAMPLEVCDDLSLVTPRVPTGQDDLTASGGAKVLVPPAYYGFILEPTIGTVALATWSAKPPTSFTGNDVALLDADPLTPGVNGITVGDHPVAIAADTIGCKIVTANEGSCDLSVLDVASAAALNPPALVDRLDVKNAAGTPIHAKPAAMLDEPAGGVIGNACPANATGQVFISYPSCHLVAEVDLATGNVVAGISFTSSGTTITDGNVSCPDECAGDPVTSGIRPVALDINYDTRTGRRLLAVGADNSNVITAIDLDANNRPASIHPVALEDKSGTLGITSVSITPQIGIGGESGIIDDTLPHQHQFIYGVGTDRSVRVADFTPATPVECDAEVDPRYLYNVTNIDTLSCMPVGDPATPPRRAGARTPGIELIADVVPTSVATYHVDTYDGDTRLAGPARMIGYYGAISSENGQVYMFNINDVSQADRVEASVATDIGLPIETSIPFDIAHQLRDALPNRDLAAVSTDTAMTPTCDDPGPDPDTANNAGGPRSPQEPARNVPDLYIAGSKLGELPYIRALYCQASDDTRAVSELEFAAPIPTRELEFPDIRGLRNDEVWTLTYQGLLSQDTGAYPTVDGPPIRTGQLAIDNANQMRLDDTTRPFCAAGVEPYDIIQLKGCDPANNGTDCPIGYECYVHPQSQVVGLGACMLTDEAERLATACQPFLTSLRRYTVQKSTSGELVLMPRKHILRTTPVDGCTDDNQCQSLANYAVQNPSTANPVDHTIVDTHKWSCQVDSALQPELDSMGQPLKRCIETCTQDSDCIVGTVCDKAAGFCMEGVIPPQSCVNAPQPFEIKGSEAFVVIGTKSGYVHPIIADASGNCVKNPNASPLQIGRIPLRAPACDPTADPRTGVNPSGVMEPNPCQETVQHTEQVTNYDPGTCNVAAAPVTLVTRSATAIKFRNRGMTLTMVDPTYPGDQTCVGDRMGGLVNVPLTAEGYQISFRQAGGFYPFILPVTGASLPVKLVKQPRGPGDAMRDVGFGDPVWVIDEGDFISTSITTASTLGRVFRVETQAPATVNTLE